VGLLPSIGYDMELNGPHCLAAHAQRYALGYHSSSQVLWGVGIGIVFGTTFYTLTELVPTRRPRSFLGVIRRWILTNEVSTWFRLRDGWLIWGDAGREIEWRAWRALVAGEIKSE
jgi:dolichyldiphosphatase